MNNKSNRFKTAGMLLATVIIGSLGYGFMAVNSQPLAIWGKDASGHVVLFPRTLTVDIASSTLSLGTTTLNNCVSTSWNPPSIGTSTPNASATSTDIAFPGAVMGDKCLGSLTSATSSAASVNCFFTGTATATIRLFNIGTTALDLATGTAQVCRFK